MPGAKNNNSHHLPVIPDMVPRCGNYWPTMINPIQTASPAAWPLAQAH